MTPEREIEIRALLKGSLMYWPQTLGPWAAIALDLIATLDQERARVAKLEAICSSIESNVILMLHALHPELSCYHFEAALQALVLETPDE